MVARRTFYYPISAKRVVFLGRKSSSGVSSTDEIFSSETGLIYSRTVAYDTGAGPDITHHQRSSTEAIVIISDEPTSEEFNHFQIDLNGTVASPSFGDVNPDIIRPRRGWIQRRESPFDADALFKTYQNFNFVRQDSFNSAGITPFDPGATAIHALPNLVNADREFTIPDVGYTRGLVQVNATGAITGYIDSDGYRAFSSGNIGGTFSRGFNHGYNIYYNHPKFWLVTTTVPNNDPSEFTIPVREYELTITPTTADWTLNSTDNFKATGFNDPGILIFAALPRV